MIQGVGIDVVDIDRFSRSVKRWSDRFVKRILTPAEISYCQSKAFTNQSMAVRFAAKEAAFKCLPPNQQVVVRWHDIEIFIDDAGRPHLRFSGSLETVLNDCRTHLSLSHMGNTAIAIVVIEQQKEE